MNELSQEASVFLNLVRFAACEMVVVGHFLTKYQPTFGEPTFKVGSSLGGVAVFLFFALSGLRICYSLANKLRTPEYRFRDYFVDRFSRIYSGLVPALFIGAVIAAAIYVTNYAYFEYLSSMQSAPSPLTFGMTLGMLERFPVAFFDSLLKPLGLTFPLPSVTPFGFNGVLWTLVVEWWVYMVFGWLIIGALSLTGRRKRGIIYKAVFFAVAVILSLVLLGLLEEFSSFIIVWFAGAVMMLSIGNEAIRQKIANPYATKILSALLVLALAVTAFRIYTAFGLGSQYFDATAGLLVSVCLFLAVLLLNVNPAKHFSKLILDRRIVNWVTAGAGFSYTLFLTHYPIIIFLSGLNLPIDRALMFLPILLATNSIAFALSYFTEKRHRTLANAIKKRFNLTQHKNTLPPFEK